MILNVYDALFEQYGIIEEIDSYILIRRFWECGEFRLLVPYSERHIKLLKMRRLLWKPGDTEMGEIRYIYIREDSQGREMIEVHGRLITCWLGKRIVRNMIETTATIPAIMRRIVQENVTNATNTARRIQNITLAPITDISRPSIEYAVEEYQNALIAIEAAAKATFLGFGIFADVRAKTYTFRIYEGRDLTANQTVNPPCIFSKEFDNINEQDFINGIENFRTTAYVGGEEIKDTPRQILEVSPQFTGLARDEIFVSAGDLKQTYKDENNQEITISNTRYTEMLRQRGLSELEHHTESLAFTSKVKTHSNLIYKEDYDLGDRVTCVNKRWDVRINVRITEVQEVYQRGIEEIHITFGENIPALGSVIQQLIKQG